MRIRLLFSLLASLWLGAFGCTKPTTPKNCPNNLKPDSNGNCVECLATSDCPAGTYCNAGTCAACSASVPACQAISGCRGDADCPAKQYCAAGSCKPGCRGDDECDPGKVCSPTAHLCEPGCTMAHACASGKQCCNGDCIDPMTDAMQCGGCGMPACMGGSECCGGTCANTQSDPKNCGACKKACPGSDPCVSGQCQSHYGAILLLDVGGAPMGMTEQRALQALALVQEGTPQQQGCVAFRYDANHPGDDADGGVFTITGYAGGMAADATTVPTQIQCSRVNGIYRCGYGALSSDGKPGPDLFSELFPAGTNILGTGTIDIQGGGGMALGTFDDKVQGGAEVTTTSDLWSLPYAAGGNIDIPYACGGAKCSLLSDGLPLVVVEASSNDAAHFADQPATWGRMICYPGLSGAATITIDQGGISTLLGTDNAIKTVRTSIGLLPPQELQAVFRSPKDDQGHYVVGLVGRGRFGFTAINQ